jgi:acyl carrier protein phosphodiesterase
MNFLAHMLLSCDREELMVGNYLADLVRNKGFDGFSPGVREGILLHRRIDAFTDAHPVVRQGTARLRARHGKYAPVVIDIFYDYILSAQWHRYSAEPLPVFAAGVYTVLLKHLPIMPAPLQRRTRLMIEDNWLVNYGTPEGIAGVFHRMKSYVMRPALLDDAGLSLAEEEERLTEEFNRFFPEMVDFVKDFCRC